MNHQRRDDDRYQWNRAELAHLIPEVTDDRVIKRCGWLVRLVWRRTIFPLLRAVAAQYRDEPSRDGTL